MWRILSAGLVLVLALFCFYVAWPAWTARQIRNAIEANDPAALERNIDFASVRARAKPLVAAEMQRSIESLKQRAGPFGAAIAGQLSESLSSKIADAAIDQILTPANVVRMVRQGKDLRRVWKDISAEPGARRPGRTPTDAEPPSSSPPSQPGGPAEPTATSPASHKLTLANIKSYRLAAPLTLEVGIARDPEAAEPDVVAELAFSGIGWTVVGIVPRL